MRDKIWGLQTSLVRHYLQMETHEGLVDRFMQHLSLSAYSVLLSQLLLCLGDWKPSPSQTVKNTIRELNEGDATLEKVLGEDFSASVMFETFLNAKKKPELGGREAKACVARAQRRNGMQDGGYAGWVLPMEG